MFVAIIVKLYRFLFEKSRNDDKFYFFNDFVIMIKIVGCWDNQGGCGQIPLEPVSKK